MSTFTLSHDQVFSVRCALASHIQHLQGIIDKIASPSLEAELVDLQNILQEMNDA